MTNAKPDTAAFLRLADGATKPNKRQAADMLKELAATIGDEHNLEGLAALYRYFLPPLPKGLKAAAKDKWKWVTLPVDPNEIRKYLRYVMADGKRICATDGHRVHCAPDDREPGLYCPVMGEKIFDLTPDANKPGNHPGRYPDVDRVMPQVKTGLYEKTRIEPLDITMNRHRDRVTSANGEEMLIDRQYWLEATAPVGDGKARVGITDNAGPLLRLEMDAFGGAQASIMGMRGG